MPADKPPAMFERAECGPLFGVSHGVRRFSVVFVRRSMSFYSYRKKI